MPAAAAVSGVLSQGTGRTLPHDRPAGNTEDGFAMLELLGRKRGMLISGGEVNTERAAITLLDEFRSGKLGRITLELPEQEAL